MRDEFAVLINLDLLGIARRAADPIEGRHNIFAALAVARIQDRHVAGEGDLKNITESRLDTATEGGKVT